MADEYINKQLLLDSMQKILDSSPDGYAVVGAYGFCVAMQVIDEYHAADVAPVRHGRWIDNGKSPYNPEFYVYECSTCGTKYQDIAPIGRYCPNCGAKMDKEDCDGNT